MDELSESVQDLVDAPSFSWFVYLTTILGSILTLSYFFEFCLGMSRKWGFAGLEKLIGAVFKNVGVTSHVLGTARTKQAGTCKVNQMLCNARDMHDLVSLKETRLEKREAGELVFQNFTLRGERYVPAGSLLWCWRSILTGELAKREGIWLPSRLLIFQVGQIIIGIFSSFVGFFIIDILAEDADEARAEIDGQWRQVPGWVVDLVPTG